MAARAAAVKEGVVGAAWDGDRERLGSWTRSGPRALPRHPPAGGRSRPWAHHRSCHAMRRRFWLYGLSGRFRRGHGSAATTARATASGCIGGLRRIEIAGCRPVSQVRISMKTILNAGFHSPTSRGRSLGCRSPCKPGPRPRGPGLERAEGQEPIPWLQGLFARLQWIPAGMDGEERGSLGLGGLDFVHISFYEFAGLAPMMKWGLLGFARFASPAVHADLLGRRRNRLGGLVPAISSGTPPRQVGGTSPLMTGWRRRCREPEFRSSYHRGRTIAGAP